MVELYKFEPFGKSPEDYPAGSLEWAEAVSCFLQLEIKTLSGGTASRVCDHIKLIFSTKPRPWEIWPDSHPFKTPDEYCRAITGHDWSTLLMMVSELTEDKELVSLRTRMQTELAQTQIEHRSPGRPAKENHAYSMVLTQGSTQSAYLLRRLARDHDEIFKQYERGEFKSVRAAAKAARIIKDATPLEHIQKLLPKLNEADRQVLFSELKSELSMADILNLDSMDISRVAKGIAKDMLAQVGIGSSKRTAGEILLQLCDALRKELEMATQSGLTH